MKGAYISFEWDEWNGEKNLIKHGVSDFEIEQVFFNPYLMFPHKKYKDRRIVLGITDGGQCLFLSVQHINIKTCRPIHARNMKNDEKQFYNKNVKRKV